MHQTLETESRLCASAGQVDRFAPAKFRQWKGLEGREEGGGKVMEGGMGWRKWGEGRPMGSPAQGEGVAPQSGKILISTPSPICPTQAAQICASYSLAQIQMAPLLFNDPGASLGVKGYKFL